MMDCSTRIHADAVHDCNADELATPSTVSWDTETEDDCDADSQDLQVERPYSLVDGNSTNLQLAVGLTSGLVASAFIGPVIGSALGALCGALCYTSMGYFTNTAGSVADAAAVLVACPFSVADGFLSAADGLYATGSHVLPNAQCLQCQDISTSSPRLQHALATCHCGSAVSTAQGELFHLSKLHPPRLAEERHFSQKSCTSRVCGSTTPRSSNAVISASASPRSCNSRPISGFSPDLRKAVMTCFEFVGCPCGPSMRTVSPKKQAKATINTLTRDPNQGIHAPPSPGSGAELAAGVSPTVFENAFMIRKHAYHAQGLPTMLVYDVSLDPPCTASESQRPRRAQNVQLNGVRGSHIRNNNFEGQTLMMHRSRDGADHGPYEAYFAGRIRRWELRIQGRFLKKPKGKLFAGCVMQDFDYSIPPSWFSSSLGSLGFGPLEAVLGGHLYFTWGSRGDDAARPSAEFAALVGGLSVFDQVIVTPAGEAPPALCEDLSSLGLRRADMAASAYDNMTQKIAAGINTEETYTFCFWGASRFIDIIGDGLVNLIPLVPQLNLSSTLLGDWPAHFVMYSLGDDNQGADGTVSDEQPRRHPEVDKTYYVDLMAWNSEIPPNDKVLTQYMFIDQL